MDPFPLTPPPQPVPAAPPKPDKPPVALRAADLVLPLVAVVILIAGSLGPWAKVAFLTKNGLDGDGVITLVLALVAGLAVLVSGVRSRPPSRVLLGICGVLALAVTVFDVIDVSGTEAGRISVSVGWGLWVALLGSLVLLVAAGARLAGR